MGPAERQQRGTPKPNASQRGCSVPGTLRASGRPTPAAPRGKWPRPRAARAVGPSPPSPPRLRLRRLPEPLRALPHLRLLPKPRPPSRLRHIAGGQLAPPRPPSRDEDSPLPGAAPRPAPPGGWLRGDGLRAARFPSGIREVRERGGLKPSSELLRAINMSLWFMSL